MHTFLLVMVKPLILALFALIAWGANWALDKLIPEGPVKRFLYKPRGASAKPTAPAVPASVLQRALEVTSPASRARPRASRR